MKSTSANVWATYEAALDLEVIKEDKPVKPVTVTAFTNDMSNLKLEELEVVNAVQTR
jgi:putative N-acetylmannosamine-6-phosphate epimerase